MRLITTHIGADFDSLASMWAALKLYGDGAMCFSGAASRNVRDFLKRNRWALNVLTPKQVDPGAIRNLVVVDARSLGRIGPFAQVALDPSVEVHVFDHHPPVEDEIPSSFSIIERAGSTTTILAERLFERSVLLTPFDCTLLALGIYEDTGALTFGATTEREYAVVAELRRRGADLASIPTWIELSFSALDRELLDRMIEACQDRFIKGYRVVSCAIEFPRYAEGISLFVHRIMDFFDADVAIAVVTMDRRTYAVIRSREGTIDARSAMGDLPAGGHPQAAAAAVPRQDPEELLGRLMRNVEGILRPSMSVEDAMSSPVMAVREDQTVEEAYRLMIRYGHSALPVVLDGHLRGIITRKDLDKAQLHGLGAVPVREFMTENVISVSPRAPIWEAHRLLVSHNVGRLPVVDRDDLVGIVTRTDMLRALYPSTSASVGQPGPQVPWEEDVSALLDRVPQEVASKIRLVTDVGEGMGLKVFLVGGFVRDLLLGRPNEDVDMVCEGDAVPLLERLSSMGLQVSIHRRYGTGTVRFPDGRKLDLATARREFYEYPVAQPKVQMDSLKHDLYRRDFSVNAMAVSLSPRWGMLVDYFGGRGDLNRGQLRVLHNLSFVEDPTRILRGVRLEGRLGFRMSQDTERLAASCVKGGMLSLLSGPKLRSELELIFRERNPIWAVDRLCGLGAWDAMFPGVPLSIDGLRALRKLDVFVRRLGRDLPPLGEESWLAFLGALLYFGNPWGGRSAMDRLSLSQKERGVLEAILNGLGTLETAIGGKGDIRWSSLCRALDGVNRVVLFAWAGITSRWRVRRRILLYLTRLCKVSPMLSGRDLIDLGVPKGPAVGAMLSRLRFARLDGEVDTLEDERAWVLKRLGDL
ncbi:CBS domain containing protein [Thermanaerovibrio acidaminovorans DSM 6589]|uniref:CBS domain containing protein n=1 Tax=Thermanaerovibrio acidaminovorans (strain ATCC 49978 / DSM 6589 / Su883) TaxID=525903 RepID=D1B9N0_THEAS|nr:CBS domain-containing protein [Thermanaerovibrio acidaminovorans]ACZ18983.1 CBS domain containing protein [Thermanaerovibrio acidaminovorans DSM 6589]